eukprot:763677-Hanusia_phi.AAC.2
MGDLTRLSRGELDALVVQGDGVLMGSGGGVGGEGAVRLGILVKVGGDGHLHWVEYLNQETGGVRGLRERRVGVGERGVASWKDLDGMNYEYSGKGKVAGTWAACGRGGLQSGAREERFLFNQRVRMRSG